MKQMFFFCLCLFVTGVAVALAAHAPQPQNGFPAFWKKFKTAVIHRDERAVAALSKFPITMSNGASNVSNSGELSRRFVEVFDRDTNAAQCFTTKVPAIDTENRDRYSIACPNTADNFVVYEFAKIGSEWKFVHREFPTKCGCR